MDLDVHAVDGNELDEIAQLLARIGNRSITAQEANHLTDRMSQLIWAAGDLGAKAHSPADDAPDLNTHNP
jgi:hypothetical protein